MVAACVYVQSAACVYKVCVESAASVYKVQPVDDTLLTSLGPHCGHWLRAEMVYRAGQHNRADDDHQMHGTNKCTMGISTDGKIPNYWWSRCHTTDLPTTGSQLFKVQSGKKP